MAIIAKTPFRLPLIAGSDFPDYLEQAEGYIVSAALDYYMTVQIEDNHLPYITVINLVEKKTEIIETAEGLSDRLIAGILKYYDLKACCQISINSELPPRSGLAGSTALIISLMNAVRMYIGKPFSSPQEIIIEAEFIEHQILKMPTGFQNFFPIALGGIVAVTFYPTHRVNAALIEPLIPLITPEMYALLLNNLLLIHFGRLSTSEDALISRERSSRSHALMSELAKLARNFRNHLCNDSMNIDMLGKMLNEAYYLKIRSGAGITSAWFHKQYQKALSVGAAGGKMCGSGLSTLLLACPPERQKTVCDAFSGFLSFPLRIAAEGAQVKDRLLC